MVKFVAFISSTCRSTIFKIMALSFCVFYQIHFFGFFVPCFGSLFVYIASVQYPVSSRGRTIGGNFKKRIYVSEELVWMCIVIQLFQFMPFFVGSVHGKTICLCWCFTIDFNFICYLNLKFLGVYFFVCYKSEMSYTEFLFYQ